MEFRELTDGEWEFIRPLLPPRAGTGRPRVDDRMVINGILYVLVTGCRWMDMPAKYGSYKTAWDRFKRGRPYRLDEKSYKSVRSAVERFFAWLTAFRRITVR